MHILEQNKIDIALAKEATQDIENEQMTLKKDKNQILLQQRDANLATNGGEHRKHLCCTLVLLAAATTRGIAIE